MEEIQNPQEYEKKRAYFEAMANLSAKENEIKSSKNYAMAYILSVSIPPIGIYYFVKYVFFADGDPKAVKAGVISLVLTLASLILSIWLTAVLFKQTSSAFGTSGQSLKDLTVPANQKSLIDLYK